MSARGPSRPRGYECRAVLEMVPIAEVAAKRAQIEAQFFSAAERDELKSRHVQSVAGGLALKRALCALFHQRFAGFSFGPAHFMLRHDPDGAPRIAGLPPPWPAVTTARRERLFVSITHTKLEAAGLVVHQQEREQPS